MDSIRDSLVGQMLRHHLPSQLRYPEEKQNPDALKSQLYRVNGPLTSNSSPTNRSGVDVTLRQDRDLPSDSKDNTDTILCGWYGEDDPANPHNWSASKKLFAIANVTFCTIVVYMTGPIYAPSQEYFMDEFGTSHEYTVLGLSLFT